MEARRWISVLIVLFAAAGPLTALEAQGQGKGRSGDNKVQQDKGGKPQQAHKQQGQRAGKQQGQRTGKQPAARQKDSRVGTARGASGREHARAVRRAAVRSADRDRRGEFKRAVTARELRPQVRRFATSGRAPERMAAGAVARAFARGVDGSAFVIAPVADRVFVRNRSGDVLVDLERGRARNLGYWDVRPIDMDARSNGPSFCRSGAGHPVWGREWCLDKGFGLGRDRDMWWGRTRDVGDIIFGRRIDADRLARDMLIATVGNVVLDRLGLHAITLGYADPLTGVWIGEPTGPQVLQVYSGAYPVAEIVDADRDDRADVMLVALRPW